LFKFLYFLIGFFLGEAVHEQINIGALDGRVLRIFEKKKKIKN
jgi:hypothetical protein